MLRAQRKVRLAYREQGRLQMYEKQQKEEVPPADTTCQIENEDVTDVILQQATELPPKDEARTMDQTDADNIIENDFVKQSQLNGLDHQKNMPLVKIESPRVEETNETEKFDIDDFEKDDSVYSTPQLSFHDLLNALRPPSSITLLLASASKLLDSINDDPSWKVCSNYLTKF